MNKDKLKQQIEDSAGNVQYTYMAHWIIVNRFKKIQSIIKICLIVLTASSTGGFLTSLLIGIPSLSWLGGLASAIALALNLYTLHFDLPHLINEHKDAANELWDVRERYKSLIVDFDELDLETIRANRDELSNRVSVINKLFPGTDSKSFKKAQKEKEKYIFNDNESKKLLHLF